MGYDWGARNRILRMNVYAMISLQKVYRAKALLVKCLLTSVFY